MASNVGGLSEVIQDGETGFLRDPHDVEGMSAVVMQLLADEERRRAVGLRARERAKKAFGRDKIVGEYVALYEELLGGE